MNHRTLGTSGLVVSTVGLGCNNFGSRLDLAESGKVVAAALDCGVTLFDTADTYGGAGGSETMLGAALGSERANVLIATKFGMDMRGANGADLGARGSRRYIRVAVEGSLRRLGTDYIDLYQMHTPDPVTPLTETVDALTELVREGKVRYLGHSNFAGWQIAHAAHLTEPGVPFVSAQNRYSLIERDAEAEVVPACAQFGLGVLPYYPLANGLLTGKVTRSHAPEPGTRLAERPAFLTDELFDRAEALAAWAADQGRSLLEVAIGGLAAQPAVGSVIAGATSAEQIRANCAAGAWVPTPAQLAELAGLSPGRR